MVSNQLTEIQKALHVLFLREANKEITKQQFFEAMEAWERCFRNNPGGHYEQKRLLELASCPRL